MATFKQQTGLTIQQAFDIFHRKNPKVYELFKKYALHLIEDLQVEETSSKLIINRIRWEVFENTKNKEYYKISDAFSSRYARVFVTEYPQYESKFRFSKLRSDDDEFVTKKKKKINANQLKMRF
jgi:hypothetical protein